MKQQGSWKTESLFYLDAEHGPDESWRRQLYGLGVTRYGDFHIGLFTVLEWPKDADPSEDVAGGSDVTRIYVGFSRDGVHFDLSWIYAGQEFLPAGDSGAWDAVSLRCLLHTSIPSLTLIICIVSWMPYLLYLLYLPHLPHALDPSQASRPARPDRG